MEDMQRLFIAIDLSAAVRRWLGEARSVLEPRVPLRSVRWTDLDGMHVTLKFLGEIPAGRIEGIRAVMDKAAQGIRPFPLAVEGLGCFPDAARPRVIWAGVRSEPRLLDLQQRLETGLENLGFSRERRAFSPHLTLGRVREGVTGANLEELGRMVESTVLDTGESMEVTGWCLFKSVLRPSGAEHSILHTRVFDSASAGQGKEPSNHKRGVTG